ncbi:MAG: ankyrin repeat domain-containing protein, partial [Candidatus Dependentiae bacterium]|nr:ankyrin repeat domain-containing protein [Candidatus Dependentiae bacterium]
MFAKVILSAILLFAVCTSVGVGWPIPDEDVCWRLLADAMRNKDMNAVSKLLSSDRSKNFCFHYRQGLFNISMSEDNSREMSRLLFEHNMYGNAQTCLSMLGISLKKPDIDKEQTLWLMDLFIKKGDRKEPVKKWLWDWAFKYDRREYIFDWYKDDANREELTPEQLSLIHGWQLVEFTKNGNFQKLLSFYHEHKNSLDINAIDEQGTALLHAVKRSNYGCVKLLLNLGADVHAYAPESQQSAFDMAMRYDLETDAYYKDRSKEHKKIYKLLAVHAAPQSWR